jgi:hypothetical protein
MIRVIFFVFKQILGDTEVFSVGLIGDCFLTNVIGIVRNAPDENGKAKSSR